MKILTDTMKGLTEMYYTERVTFQGIFHHVRLENKTLGPWKMTAYPLNDTYWLSSMEPVKSIQLPAFYRTRFTLPEKYTKCLDTYLDTSGWTKVL